MNYTISKLNNNQVDDFVALISIYKEVFDMPNLSVPDISHLQNLIENPNFIVLVAKMDKQIIGGLTVHLLPSYLTTKLTAYIYDVGVSQSYQRMGVGQRLIEFIINYCKENNIAEAYVEAESDDHQAVNFYLKTKYQSMLNATHFTYLTA